mgnify:CR=1 FL=1
MMEQLIKAIVAPLVEHPAQIELQIREHDGIVTYSLSVHSDDKGKVIGKQGSVAKAIRTVVNAAASYRNQKVYVEIL